MQDIKKKKNTIFFRADADTRMGTGHVMRCLALAQACLDDGERATLVAASAPSALEDRLKAEGMEVVHLQVEPGSAEDAQQTADLAREAGASALVLDGYQFEADYQKALRDSSGPLLVIDDDGRVGHYTADVVLNQNLHANEELYSSREAYTRLLLGTRYVALRREFMNWKDWKRLIPETAKKVLVTMGGGDPDNVTLEAIHALRKSKVEGLEAVVVAGASNPNFEALSAAAKGSKVPVRLERNAEDMPKLMAWADLAVAAGGTTAWELAFMGLPSIVLTLADNQRCSAHALAEKGAFVHLGESGAVTREAIAQAVAELSESETARRELSQRGSRLVDGLGVKRVLEVLRHLGRREP